MLLHCLPQVIVACEKEIHLLRKELQDAKQQYHDLRDGKESLAEQEVGSFLAVCMMISYLICSFLIVLHLPFCITITMFITETPWKILCICSKTELFSTL